MKNPWNYEDSPDNEGWYPVLFCYSEEEGLFNGASHWNTRSWDRPAVVAFGKRQIDRKSARLWAYKHSPE